MKKLLLLIIGLLATFQIGYAAIAFDSVTAVTATAGVTNKTFTHTTSGSNRVLFVITGTTNAVTVNSVTYNGVSMTLAGSYVNAQNNKLAIYYLAAPATGANTVSITTSGTDTITGGSISFTGASQTGIPDAMPAGDQSGALTTYSKSVTTVADNCFQLLALFDQNGLTMTGGTNTTIGSQPEVVVRGTAFVYSTTAKTPAGSATLTVSAGSLSLWTGLMLSFAPAATVSTPSTYYGAIKFFRRR